jgi:hypothetical protein
MSTSTALFGDLVSTVDAARALGVRYHRLFALLRDNLIALPARDSSGRYWFAPGDIAAARQALAARQIRGHGKEARLQTLLAEIKSERENVAELLADAESNRAK